MKAAVRWTRRNVSRINRWYGGLRGFLVRVLALPIFGGLHVANLMLMLASLFLLGPAATAIWGAVTLLRKMRGGLRARLAHAGLLGKLMWGTALLGTTIMLAGATALEWLLTLGDIVQIGDRLS